MRYRRLGEHGPRVSVLGFGAMSLTTGIYDDVTAEDARTALLAALDTGTTFVDTADIYGGDGESERTIGRVLGARRDEIVLATKFGGDQDAGGRLVPGLGRPAYVRDAIDASLRRLRTDHVDLYYLHRLDPTTPVEDTVGALAGLVEAGKIRHIGLSEVSPATLRRAHAVHPVTALQTEYSLFHRDPEDELLAVCAELGVGFVAYSPLGRGLLGGGVRGVADLGPRDWRHTNPRFQSGNIDHNVTLVGTLADLAAAHGIGTAQLALAWLLHRGAFPIPGTRRAANVRANAEAAELRLPTGVFDELESLLPRGAAAGERADERYLAGVDTGA
ncbi:aldo/keto reductase [Streptomyces marincola]|uniref:aldo/keto reductase n=1 Tax=Streptomyces marincola TaxID=2878388 RepID=UPI001CF18AD7|nr:aldo/keto reductase [Streptomyces marincola]UCM90043.1 aldo/keto reductase [Streptomyces marincola]